MEDWDKKPGSVTAIVPAPVKLSGLGRGNLAKVFGEKLRGIGRGYTEKSQSNEFSERRYAAENGSVPNENGFNGHVGGGFGNTRNEDSSGGFSRKTNSNSDFGGGRTDGDSSGGGGYGRVNNDYSGEGFGSRKDEGSNGGFSKKNYNNSGGGFSRTDEDRSMGFGNKNNGNSGGGFSRTDEDKSERFGGQSKSNSGGGFSRTDEDRSMGFGNIKSSNSGGGFSRTDEDRNNRFSNKNNGNSGGGFSRTDEDKSLRFGGQSKSNSGGGFGRRADENSSTGFSGKSQGVPGRSFGSYNSHVNGNAEDSENSRFGSRGGYREGRGRGGGQGSRPGDWTCPNSSCGNSNFAFRQCCQKCETAKPSESGNNNGFQGQEMSRSGGGRSGRNEDWVCPDEECGNNNFAYRSKCQKCDTPKPETRSHVSNGERFDKSGNSQPAPTRYIPPTPSDREEDIFGETVLKGINFDKYEEIPVEVSGHNPCECLSSYDDAELFPTILENIKRARYEKPTPIQKYSIPIIMSGRDLMACAQTGSGKTAAFLLPVLTAIINQGLPDRHQGVQTPKAICVVPTRELAIQIHADCRKFIHKTDIRAVVVYGGTSVGHQLRQVECGADFVIGTPGRLLDIVNRGKISLQGVSFLILDEADQMLDMGFEPDIRKLVETFGLPSKTQRQTLMFSATFPEKIQELAADFLNNYLFVTVGRVGGANTDVSQHFFEVEGREKTNHLVDILSAEEGVKTLVFVNAKRFVDFLASYLCEMQITATSIHGDRLQQEREEALNDFKSGKRRVLVATSVAARGLDIPEVMHVVNYDMPNTVDEYVHRIGRTGRCGNLGKATSFFSSSNSLLASGLVRILKEADQTVPEWLEAYACGMKTDQDRFTSGNDRFGGKDIRRGKFHHGGRDSQNNAGDNWGPGAGADCDTVKDDESWG